MLDLALLNSFVAVVDAGGFTRAGTRVHRTQSTISQQVKRLEEQLGHVLLKRTARGFTLTQEGERLLLFARRLLAIELEARDAVHSQRQDTVRLGVTEDIGAWCLPRLIATIRQAQPEMKIEVHCAVTSTLHQLLDQDQLDMAMVKRDASEVGAVATWPDQLVWVAGRAFRGDLKRDPIPLVVFGPACLYHNRSLRALESMGRDWKIVYTSPNTPGVQAAVTAGIGVAMLPQIAVLNEHRVLAAKNGFPSVIDTQIALLTSRHAPAFVLEAAQAIAGCGATLFSVFK